MTVLQRLCFPSSADILRLYFDLRGPCRLELSENASNSQVYLASGAFLSSNCFFNSFYEAFIEKHTNIRRPYYEFFLEGEGEIILVRERRPHFREVIAKSRVSNLDANTAVRVDIPCPSVDEKDRGRIYFELRAGKGGILFRSGAIKTDEPALRKVKPAIISVTYHREEYIQSNIHALLRDKDVMAYDPRIFVIDNGRSLDVQGFNSERVTVLPNDNDGGSGGFNKGMMAAMKEPEITHLALMDDDVIIETESVRRLFALYSHAVGDVILSGALLDIDDKALLDDARHHTRFWRRVDRPDFLYDLMAEPRPDFGSGFWLFAMPVYIPKKIGLLLPIFIHFDDLEYCIRILKMTSYRILAAPGIGVWHHSWDDSTYHFTPILTYYGMRNNLITCSLYETTFGKDGLRFVTRYFLKYMRLYDYANAEAVILALFDWSRGPSRLTALSSSEHHVRITERLKQLDSRKPVPLKESLKVPNAPQWRLRFCRRWIQRLLLYGHLIPSFWMQSKICVVNEKGIRASIRISELWIHKSFKGYFRTRILHRTGLRLYAIWVLQTVLTRLFWSRINGAWRGSFERLAFSNQEDLIRSKPCRDRENATEEISRP